MSYNQNNRSVREMQAHQACRDVPVQAGAFQRWGRDSGDREMTKDELASTPHRATRPSGQNGQQPADQLPRSHLAAQYGKLKEPDIKALVVEDKWLTQLATDVQGELDRVSQALTARIRQLAERYAAPLPQVVDEVEVLAAKVEGHLAKMGFGA